MRQETLKKFKRLNSFLRHNTISHLNTANLALDIYQMDESKQFLEMVKGSIEMVLEASLRMHDIESIIQSKKTVEWLKIPILVNQVKKRFSGDVSDIKVSGNTNLLIGEYFESILSCIMRNALKYRNASKFHVKVNSNGQQHEITIQDDGKRISETLVEILENNLEFNSVTHEQSDLDLFLAREISNSFNYTFTVFNTTTNSVEFVLKSRNQSLNS